MNASTRFLQLPFFCILCCGAAFSVDEPPDSPGTARDIHQDPLPDGAIARLGTIRYRHPGWYKSVAFLPKSHSFVVGTPENSAWTWDAETGRLLAKGPVVGQRLESFAVLSDGSGMATLATDFAPGAQPSSAMLIIRRQGRGMHFRWDETRNDRSQSLAVSHDATFAVTGTSRGSLKLWDAATGDLIRQVSLFDGEVECIDISPDGRLIAAGGRSGVAILDRQSDAGPQVLEGLSRGGQAVRFSHDGTKLAVGSSYDVAARLWDVEEGRWKLVVKGDSPRYDREGFSFTADDRQLIVPAHQAKTVEFFDTETGELIRTLDAGGLETRGAAISDDGQYLVAVDSQAAIVVWDLKTGRRISGRFARRRNAVAGERKCVWTFGCSRCSSNTKLAGKEPRRERGS